MFRRLQPLPFLIALLLTGCVSTEQRDASKLVPGDPAAPSQVTPQEALGTARVYCTHPWCPFARNIMHGTDRTGVRIDTPDAGYCPASGRNGWWVPGVVNEGIPYKWGGFDAPSSFDSAIASGRAGGDVSTPGKRQADNAAVSAYAAGVDCSGFVSRCLNLPKAYDSACLPSLCEPLASADQLRAGDLLNIPHHHVMLVAGWASRDHSLIYYYETGGIPDWKPGLKVSPLTKLLDLGYKPLRYRGMAREAGPSGKEILTRAVRSSAIVVPDPVIGEP